MEKSQTKVEKILQKLEVQMDTYLKKRKRMVVPRTAINYQPEPPLGIDIKAG